MQQSDRFGVQQSSVGEKESDRAEPGLFRCSRWCAGWRDEWKGTLREGLADQRAVMQLCLALASSFI